MKITQKPLELVPVEDKEARELNERVAKKLGWIKPTGEFEPWKLKDVLHPCCTPALQTATEVPNYVGDIRAAWEIGELLKEQGRAPLLAAPPDGLKRWSFTFYDEKNRSIVATADTAPEAIVRAFLKLP